MTHFSPCSLSRLIRVAARSGASIVATAIIPLLCGSSVAQKARPSNKDESAHDVVRRLPSDREVTWVELGQDQIMVMTPSGPCGTVARVADTRFGFAPGKQNDNTVMMFRSWTSATTEARTYCKSWYEKTLDERKTAQEMWAWRQKRDEESQRDSPPPSYAPKVVSQVETEIPEEGRREQVNGTVIVGVTVDANGKPTNPSVVSNDLRGPQGAISQSLLADYYQSAITTVMQYKFKPGMQNGKVAPCGIQIQLDFHTY